MSLEDKTFLELLDEYFDEELVSEKINLDSENHKKNDYNNARLEFNKDNTISIRRFVNEYLAIDNECYGLLHKGLKSFESPYIMTISNEFAYKNPEYVQNGYLVLVVDSYNNLATYINPYYLKRVIETGNIEEEFRVFSKKEINDFNELLEFYNKYCQLQEKYENNKKFFQLLKAVNKDKKVRKLIKQESGQHNE